MIENEIKEELDKINEMKDLINALIKNQEIIYNKMSSMEKYINENLLIVL